MSFTSVPEIFLGSTEILENYDDFQFQEQLLILRYHILSLSFEEGQNRTHGGYGHAVWLVVLQSWSWSVSQQTPELEKGERRRGVSKWIADRIRAWLV